MKLIAAFVLGCCTMLALGLADEQFSEPTNLLRERIERQMFYDGVNASVSTYPRVDWRDCVPVIRKRLEDARLTTQSGQRVPQVHYLLQKQDWTREEYEGAKSLCMNASNHVRSLWADWLRSATDDLAKK